MADASIDSAAKRLVASYMKVHDSHHDSVTELKHRAKICEEIQWKRAYKKELQQFLSGLQILKYGLQGGHGSGGSLEGAISRQTHDAVLTLMEKYPVALGPRKKPPPPPASNDQDIPQQDLSGGLLKSRMQDVIRYQEQQLDALKRSHKFLQLQHAKEEEAKARLTLEAIESALQQEVDKSDHYADQIRQEFTSLAIQVGEEQERCEQVNAQLDAIANNRDSLLQPTEFGSVESMDGLEDKGAGQAAVTNAANQQQLSDADDHFAGVGLSFLNLNEFNLGVTFKNPNSFPEILDVIDSQRGYEKIVKDIETAPRNEVASRGESGNNRKLRPRKASVVLEENAENADSAVYLFRSRKRQKMVENVQQPHQKSTDDQVVIQHDNSSAMVAENNSKLNNQENPVRANAESSVKSIEGQEREAQIKKAPTKRAVLPKVSTKQLTVAQNETQEKPPTRSSENPKPQAATTSSAAKEECTSVAEVYKTPVNNVLGAKPFGKQPEPKEAHHADVSMSCQISGKNLRNVPSRRSTHQPGDKFPKRTPKQPRKKQVAANAGASKKKDNSDKSDTMEEDSTLELMLDATATNQGSLDDVLQSPTRFFDTNLSNDSLKTPSDIDMTDLDFLKDDDAMLLQEPASKEAKGSKKKGLDDFDFNFNDQDNGENLDSTEGEFF